jgi:OFA family oxalate/formate antiporter-like MFS transporter
VNSTRSKEAWKVLLAGLCINLTIGVVYSWSVIKKALVNDWGWTNSQASLPYSIAIVIWAITLLFAGRMQDRLGPKKVVTLGAFFTGLGLIISGFITSPTAMIISYGVLTGGGIGFAYASVTPPALKWFHASKKGMVTGIVVSGMGLASLYIAPLTTALLNYFGISMTFVLLGCFIILIGVPVAQLIKNPPADYVPQEAVNSHSKTKKSSVTAIKDFTWKEMMGTHQFYFFWVMFAFTSSAGLMIIGNIAMIAKSQANMENGFYLVGLLAIFNACGRLIGGFLSDRIGRVNTMKFVFALQAVNMLLFASFTTPVLISLGTALAGIGYGALLSLFPSVVADYYGVKNFGGNYGVLYTAWGVSGIIGPIISGIFVDLTGTYTLAYFFSAALLGIALVIAFLTQPIKDASMTIYTESLTCYPENAKGIA